MEFLDIGFGVILNEVFDLLIIKFVCKLKEESAWNEFYELGVTPLQCHIVQSNQDTGGIFQKTIFLYFIIFFCLSGKRFQNVVVGATSFNKL